VGERRTPSYAESPQTRAAIAYATRMHADQCRADGTPFIRHPLEVASLLRRAGAPDHLVAAGVMHDLLEKTEVSADEMERRFGTHITRLVVAVSDDERIAGYAERKAALRRQVAGAGEEALASFAADKLSKVRELGGTAGGHPAAGDSTREVRAVRARRLRHYQRSLALLEERLPESPLVRDLRDELGTVLREQPRRAAIG
jgi:GTP diphosphokinase / guanosine-3',5'-bis(diphosphate) 3'-diphosphatase